MSNSVLIWAHCFACKTLVRELNAGQLLVTQCGKLLCLKCCPRSRYTACPTCVGGCSTMQMNNKAPQNIQNLFKDVSSQLKPIFKILNWQESQKKSIVEYKMMEARRLDEQHKLQEDEFSQLERQVEQKRHRLQSLEAKEAQLRAEVNSLTRRSSGGGGAPGSRERHHQQQQNLNSSLMPQSQQWAGPNPPARQSPGPLSSAFYKSMQAHSPANSFLGGLDSSRRSAGSGGSRRSGEKLPFTNKPSNSGFLQMPTPQAWYKNKTGFQR